MADYKKKKNPTTESMNTVKKHISENIFSRIYLFFGDESYLVKQYKDMLVKALVTEGDTMNFTTYSADTFNIDSVANDAVTMPFLAEHRVVLVEESGIFDKSDDELLSIVSQMSDSNILIFAERKVDKRKKLYTGLNKLDQASCLEFSTLDNATLVKWISSILGEGELKVRATVPEKLLSVVGNDMYMLRNEAGKLHDFCMEKGEINDNDIDIICTNPVEDKIFEMCDALSKGDKKKALSLYNDLCILKTKPMTVLFLITRQYNQLIQINQLLIEGKGAGEIAKFMKSPEFAVRKNMATCKNYKGSELIRALDMCQDADLAVKTGRLTDVNAVENLIINL